MGNIHTNTLVQHFESEMLRVKRKEPIVDHISSDEEEDYEETGSRSESGSYRSSITDSVSESDNEQEQTNDAETITHLVVDEVILVKSLEGFAVDPKQLAVLFKVDEEKDGKFTLKNIINFAEWCRHVTKDSNLADFQTEVQAQCTLHMWNRLISDSGKQEFVEWFQRLFLANMPVKHFDYHPNVDFLRSDNVKTLHELLNIKGSYGIEFQTFLDMMQRVGEEMGILQLEDAELDDVLPLVVFKLFAENFIDGFLVMMSKLGFSINDINEAAALLAPANNSTAPAPAPATAAAAMATTTTPATSAIVTSAITNTPATATTTTTSSTTTNTTTTTTSSAAPGLGGGFSLKLNNIPPRAAASAAAPSSTTAAAPVIPKFNLGGLKK